ncbi:uncharacterized protein LOC117898959 [Drosophila subobscura]|uniref:uncharacterized protein LOC117898959 n=1 Tax=Drosophila subobscura TaxID=7241 RepID=UPI00155A9101|nr:uncharacterized protein LOC117898959 [Drosophila subobscura]XP_034664588.1 uncharacterized protein LOC117898959 [Drosophila subobscura]
MQKQEEVLSRLRQILDIFLRDNFSTTNNVYFEKLLTHLKAKENAYVMQAPFIVDWVDKCMTMVTEDFNKIHPKVISFMLNLTSYLASNQWMIVRLRELDIVGRTIKFLQTDDRQFSPSIKLGGIRLMKAVARFSMGLAFMRIHRTWALLIQYSNNDHTLYVVREARQVLFEMLYKSCDKLHDKAVTLEILAEIMKPIHDNLYKTTDPEVQERIHINVDDNELLHKISATLDLLSYILQQTLVHEERTMLISLMKEYHEMEITIWKLIDMTHNPYFVEKIFTALSSYYFALLLHEKLLNPDVTEPPEECTEFGLSFFNLMKFFITRSDGVGFVKMAELNHILWKKLGARAPKEIIIQQERVTFENQLICFHMLPLLFSMKYAQRESDEATRTELFDAYILKLMEISCEQTFRMCYSMRDAFFTPEGVAGGLFTPELANKCIHSILALEHVLDREQAITVCQALLYVLREVVAMSALGSSDQEDCHSVSSVGSSANTYRDLYPRGTELVVNDPKVLHSVMVGLRTLIERFKITWKESVETIGLVNCLAFVLENTNMDARCNVQALKLVQLAVEHFLSPNMALLVDNLQGSALVCLGPIIVKRMHDTTWEVRDTTLELTTSIASISRIKFPAFQQFLIDSKIPPIVYEMAKNDSESYVRASAFKCLSQMVSINLLWENGLSQLDLVDHLLFVLYRDNDDIVRAEAVITLMKIYEHRKIHQKYKNTLFSTLNYCVVGDHHSEVKMNALMFWRREFFRQFSNQGMIDGVFPTVTFSKEHKKIVTLTEKEIQTRIAKVFREGQQYGYFGIIIKCLREEVSTEVLEFLVRGLKIMNEKIERYKGIMEEVELRSPPPSDEPSSSFNFKPQEPTEPQPSGRSSPVNPNKADEIIEGILNSQDAQLLETAFQTQMQINEEGDEKRHVDEFYYKQFAMPLRQFFVELKTIDMDKLIKQQEEWIDCTENLTSLLDDILCAIKHDDENMISDCY